MAACGAGRRGVPAVPDVAPEWARVRRAGVGHDLPHRAARRGGGGEREVCSICVLEYQSIWLPLRWPVRFTAWGLLTLIPQRLRLPQNIWSAS